MSELPIVRGKLRVELREPGGPTLLRREACNTVARSGAALLAALFTGTQSGGVDGVAVGSSELPNGPPYEIDALTTSTPGGDPLISANATRIDPEEFEVEVVAEEFRVRVSLRTLIPAGVAVHPDPEVASVRVGEAALGVLNGDESGLEQIYNRVVFEPFEKGRNHEIALYWEISFPYGASA